MYGPLFVSICDQKVSQSHSEPRKSHKQRLNILIPWELNLKSSG